MTSNMIKAYRVGIVATIGVYGWLLTTFQTKEAFSEYRKSHDEVKLEIVSTLRADIADLRADVRGLRDKIDQLMRGQKAVAGDVKILLENKYEGASR